MNQVKNKFVLSGNRLIGGRVEFHRQLLNPNESAQGGGWWYYDCKSNKLILYGYSFDFGSVTEEQIKNKELDGLFRSLQTAEIIFDTRDQSEVLQIMTDNLGQEKAMDIVAYCDYI